MYGVLFGPHVGRKVITGHGVTLIIGRGNGVGNLRSARRSPKRYPPMNVNAIEITIVALRNMPILRPRGWKNIIRKVTNRQPLDGNGSIAS
jgi:hypothetical protein